MRRPAKTSDPEEMRDELPSESWRGPRGQILSWRDPISLSLSPADKGALARAIDEAIRSYLDEARSGSLEDRVSFLARLLRVQDQIRGGGDPLVIARIDLPAVHGALHAAAGHAIAPHLRGTDTCGEFARRLVRIRERARHAVWDHDDVPMADRPDPLR